MKKHYILIWVDNPGFDDPQKNSDYETVAGILGNLAIENKDIVTLAKSAWLIPRDDGLPFVAGCMERASKYQLTVHTKFLQGDV
ncbi:MAG: hypothetical protein WBS33_00475 [Verrucomicrobiia bacterium]